MHSKTETELRQYSRIPFDTCPELLVLGRTLQVQLLDISLKGALVETPELEALTSLEPCRLVLTLAAAAGEVIAMNGIIAHLEGRHVGVQCQAIELSSLTRLRRLLELNTGDADLMERELSHLIRHPSQ